MKINIKLDLIPTVVLCRMMMHLINEMREEDEREGTEEFVIEVESMMDFLYQTQKGIDEILIDDDFDNTDEILEQMKSIINKKG